MSEVAAHDQAVTHRYVVHYPAHAPRPEDPHYIDFEHYRQATKKTARCYVGERVGPESCAGELELHHAHIEFALQQGVSFAALERDYPGISNPDQVGAWVESDANLRWLCVFHHRGHAGAHTAAHADWEAQLYVPHLIG